MEILWPRQHGGGSLHVLFFMQNIVHTQLFVNGWWCFAHSTSKPKVMMNWLMVTVEWFPSLNGGSWTSYGMSQMSDTPHHWNPSLKTVSLAENQPFFLHHRGHVLLLPRSCMLPAGNFRPLRPIQEYLGNENLKLMLNFWIGFHYPSPLQSKFCTHNK